jgi:hypothetical protein
MHAFVLALLLATVPTVIDTTKMAEGQSVVTQIDGATVTVTREGETRRVVIERPNRRDEVTILRDGEKLRISTGRRGESFMVPTPRIIVDGIAIEPFITDQLMSRRPKSTVYVCPNDRTELRLPHRKHDGDFKCPLDGTLMRPAQNPEYFLLQLSN